MREELENLKTQIESFEILKLEQVEEFRLKYLTKKSELNDLVEKFKTVPGEMKKEIGQLLNLVKDKAKEKFLEAQNKFEHKTAITNSNKIDFTLPSELTFNGARHPLAIIENDIITIFTKLGFVYAEGPEIEDDWHNFSALNFPKNHPARDMQDTFWIKANKNIKYKISNIKDEAEEKSERMVLRTHTSSVQIR